LQGGGFASFFKNAPYDSTSYNTTNIAFANTNPYSSLGAADPLNYPVRTVTVGNGLGFNTLEPAFGFPAGGLGPDNRIGIYFGDSWKIKPNLTLSLGVRYDRDTGRTDSDLPAIPEINALYPGYGNRVQQANKNFAPQLGIAWDPTKSGKTVVRAGIGLYYENVIWNNVLFDRPLRLQNGAFLSYPVACANYQPQPVATNIGFITAPDGVCSSGGNPIAIGNAAPAIAAFQALFQSLNPLNLSAHNPNYIGDALAAGVSTPLGLFAPNYQSPRSLQMNFGIQRQIRSGMIFSADYLRNVETHSLLGIDVNHVGDVSHFDPAAASQAIQATLAACGAGSIDAAMAPAGCTALEPATTGVQMSDFASYGLTSSNDFGGACATNAFDPVTGNPLGRPCAFGGINPAAGAGLFLKPIGRSVYNALQMKLTQNVTHPNVRWA
jgi:hypothetical protein